MAYLRQSACSFLLSLSLFFFLPDPNLIFYPYFSSVVMQLTGTQYLTETVRNKDNTTSKGVEEEGAERDRENTPLPNIT